MNEERTQSEFSKKKEEQMQMIEQKETKPVVVSTPELKNELKDLFKAIFEGQEFGYLVTNDKQPLFVAKDVCEILGIANSRDAVSRLDEDEKLTSVLPTSGQNREMTMITISGLFSLIHTSRKPEAKRLKKFVNKEILPQILLTGSYNAQPQLPQTFSEALRLLADTTDQKEQLLLENNALQSTVIENLNKKVDIVDTLINCDQVWNFTEVAKDITGVETARKSQALFINVTCDLFTTFPTNRNDVLYGIVARIILWWITPVF